MAKATKGHFYNVEKRFNSMESLRSVIEDKGKKIGVDKDDLKRTLRALKMHEVGGSYLWIITESNRAYLVKDERTDYIKGYDFRDKLMKVFTVSKYVFQITAENADKIIEEINFNKILERG